MKRTITVTEAEYQEFIAHKRSRMTMEDVKKRTINLTGKIERTQTIAWTLGNAICRNSVSMVDKHDAFLPAGGSIWENDYFNLSATGPLDCDISLKDSIKLEERYPRWVFQGTPCSERLKNRIERVGKAVESLNETKGVIIDFINGEIAPLMWQEANEFMKKREEEEARL